MLAFFRKFVFSLLIAFAAANVCFAQALLDTEEYTVYSALLKALYNESHEPNLTICRKTTADPLNDRGIRSLLKKSSSLDSLILHDFNARNETQFYIENRFDIERKINLVEEKEVKSITERALGEKDPLGENGWKEFRKIYGSSPLLYLSRIGFNRQRSRALLLFGYQSGWLGGEGNYYILEKQSSGWKVRKKIRGWIS